MTNTREKKERLVDFNEVQACIGFAGALNLLTQFREIAPLSISMKIDSAAGQLAKELDVRLTDLGTAMHEESIRNRIVMRKHA